MSFNFDRFIHDANASFITHVGDLRYGQYLMNELSNQYPEVSIPEEYDCFYNNDKVPDFLRYISQYQSLGQSE
jgi:hypothetical protein